MQITLGLRQYVIAALAILSLLVVMGMAVHPALYVAYIQEACRRYSV